MRQETAPVSTDDLHHLVDGRVDDAERRRIEAWLDEHPQEQQQADAWRQQRQLLHDNFDDVLSEPMPSRLAELAAARPRIKTWALAAGFAWLSLGVLIGYFLRGPAVSRIDPGEMLAHRAAIAHAIYTPEVRHPVEVGADQEAHLVAWLSKRLDKRVRAPHFSSQGYTLVGGRLLPGDDGPVAQFMYQDSSGKRLTLYVRGTPEEKTVTAFRFAQEGKVSVFYWIDGSLAYALSGEMPREQLLALSETVYRELNP
jgi:anti-sigma factor RsiW